MANPNIQIDVGGNTARLQRDINKVANTPISLDIRSGSRASSAPLGRITGDIADIDKSLSAANARVVAFAASAGVIYGLESAVRSLVQTFVNVEKRLADVNVLLNLSEGSLASFGSSLFSIAGNTAQSFDTVAEAATELARQGLGVEETLKRTNDALVLTRLSGLDAASSVKALTAAINSFSDAGLTSSEVINKLANVDAGFAVSSADLANAISRVGSSASDAGVSFDELIALVTTAQQITSRGGAVIGNSLKTIFTRLGRSETQNLLQGLGVSLTDQNGQIKNQVQLLQDLAKIYDTLPQIQKNQVAEQVGGVFQINVLKAALGDLGKEYSIYNQALQTSITSTDQAIQRNEQLNKTLSARGAKAFTDIQQAGITIAQPLFKPLANNLLNISDLLTGAINTADASGFGAKIGRGLLEGLGNFIGGPGLALITAALAKLFAQFSKVGVEAFKSILGANSAAKEQAAIQANVAKFLQQNAGLYGGIQKGQVSATAAAQQYLTVIQQQTQALQQQQAIAQQIASIVSKNLSIQTIGGGPVIAPRKLFSGFIPNFADPNAMAEIAGAKAYGYKPGKVVKERIYDGTGKSFTAYRNLAETRTDFINADGKKATMIEPPNGFSKDTLTAYSGFIPNFAQNPTLYELQRKLNSKKITDQERAAIQEQINSKKPISINLNSIGGVGNKYGLLFAQEGAGAARFSQNIGGKDTPKLLEPLAKAGRKGVITAGLRFRSIYPPDPSGVRSASASFSQKIDQFLQPGFEKLASDIASGLGGTVSSKPENVSSLLPPGAKGTIFEKAVSAATKKPGPKLDKNINDNAPFDFDPISSFPLLNQLFGKNIGSAVEAKIGKAAAANIPNKILNREPAVAKKILQQYMPKQSKKSITAFSGFIPNFANSLKEAIKREKDAGIPNGSIYLSQEKELAGLNPFGIGVFNKKDEPNKMARKAAMSSRGFSSGFIPNFALATENLPSGSSAAFDLTTMMMSLTIAATMMQNNQKDVGASFKTFAKDLKEGKGGFLKALNSGTVDLADNARVIESTTKNIEASKNLLTNRVISDEGRSKIESVLAKNEQALRQAQLNKRISSYQSAIRTQGLGYGFAGQALSGVAAQMLGGADTKGGSIATAMGNIAGFAGIGAAFGPKGAIIGAAVGALTSLPQVVSAFNDDLKNASMAAAKAATALADFDTVSQSFLQADQEMAGFSGQGDSKEFKRSSDKFYMALSKMPEEIQNKISEARSSDDRRELVAQYRQSLLNEANISKLGEVAAEKLSFGFGDVLGESVGFLGSSFGLGADEKSAQAIGSDLAKLIGIGDGAKNAEEGLKKFANGMPILAKAQGELGKILEARATDNTLMDRGVRQLLDGSDAEKARAVFSRMVNELAATGGDVPDAIKNIADNIDNASVGEIQSALSGFSNSFTEQMSQLQNTIDLENKAKEAFKALPQATQEYINNISSAIKGATIQDFSDLQRNQIRDVQAPKFAEEVKRFGEDFFSQFRNASSFIGKIDPLARVQKDLELGIKELEYGAVGSFAADFIPSLNGVFQGMLGTEITGEDTALVSYGMEILRDNIVNAKSLADIGSFDDLVKSAPGIQPLRESSELKGAYEDAMGKAIGQFDSQMQTLRFENEKARVQAGLNNAINNFQKAMANLDALPRADLTGFKNPFREIARSRGDLIRQYNDADASIAQQYQDGRAQAMQIEDPAQRSEALRRIANERNRAMADLNRNYNRSMADLNDQADALREAAAKEAIGFAIAGQAGPEVVNAAINKYLSSIQDRIKEYAAYLGVSTGEVEKLMKQKLQKDAGMIPDGFGQLANEIKKWMAEANKLNIDGKSAADGLAKLIYAGPQAGEAVLALMNSSNQATNSWKQAVADLNNANLNQPLNDLKTNVGTLAEAVQGAANKINSIIINPPGPQNPMRPTAAGFIPNFASLSKSKINQSKKLERQVSGKPAQFYQDPFPHVRNSSQPTFESAMRDHGGLKNALIDSNNLQNAYGFGNKKISNFASYKVGQYSDNALKDENVDKNKAEKFKKIFSKFGKKISNFAYNPSLVAGNAPDSFKKGFLNIQQFISKVSQNLGLGFDEVGPPKSLNIEKFTHGGALGASARVLPTGDVQFQPDALSRSRSLLLKIIANEASHVNQLASNQYRKFETDQNLAEHDAKLKGLEGFLMNQGAMVNTKHGPMVRWDYDKIIGDQDIKNFRQNALNKQEEGTKSAKLKFKSNSEKIMNEASNFAISKYNGTQDEILRNATKSSLQLSDEKANYGKALDQVNKSAISWSADQMGGYVASETQYSQGSSFYLVERFSSLMDGLVGAVQIGSITADEMVGARLAKDIEEANAMLGLVYQTEDTLRKGGFNVAGGFVPNFSNIRISKLNEKAAAKSHGYTAGQPYQKRIWNGSGQSINAMVNSAEDVIDFKNSRGFKSTMVVPPNGFGNGFLPQFAMMGNQPNESNANSSTNIFQQKISDAADQTNYFTSSTQEFVKDTGMMSKSVKEAVDAINNFSETALSFSSQNVSVEPQVSVESPQITVAPPEILIEPTLSSNVTLSNPVVSPTFNLQVEGLGGVENSISEIKSTLVSTIQSQASRIDYLSQQLRDLKFSITKRSI